VLSTPVDESSVKRDPPDTAAFGKHTPVKRMPDTDPTTLTLTRGDAIEDEVPSLTVREAVACATSVHAPGDEKL
jgi:hypothetical protein